MKKIVSVFILVLAVVFTADAQQKRKRMIKEQMTPEQTATLAIKKMTLELDLSNSQQKKLKTLLISQISERKELREKMRKARKEKKELSADQRFERANERLDKQLAFQKEVKSILNQEQFEKFKKMEVKKRMATRKRMGNMKKKMAWKKMKDQEEKDDN